jgi:carbamoyl-phosphate synthase large subunit
VKVLVTGAGALLGQGLIRSLRMSELNPFVVAVDPSPLSAGLYWADASYVVPMASEQNYIESIETILEFERPDALLIGTDVELEVFAAQRHRLEKLWSLKIIVSAPSAIAIADDKFLTYQFLKESGFAPPESRLANSARELVDLFGYPLVVKPRKGARSVGFAVVRNDKELNQALSSAPEMLVQEFLSGAHGEYTAGTLTFEGRCEALIVMRRDLRDGNTYRAFTIKDLEIGKFSVSNRKWCC